MTDYLKCDSFTYPRLGIVRRDYAFCDPTKLSIAKAYYVDDILFFICVYFIIRVTHNTFFWIRTGRCFIRTQLTSVRSMYTKAVKKYRFK
jgi:hypothetical protein